MKITRYFSTRNRSAVLGLMAASLFTTAASAAPPANVTGLWNVLVDQTYTTLNITSQGGGGGPGGSNCRLITGDIGIAPIQGYYCPASGLMHFLHRNLNNGFTVRDFTATVSDATANQPAHMAGTFHVVNVGFGPFGEYPFSGAK